MARFGLATKGQQHSEYFHLFDEAGANILRAAELLDRLLRSWPDANGLSREILICEQEGDRITHDLIQLLNRRIPAPIDREDIYRLASALDDIVDYTEEAADFLGLYNIDAPMEQSQQLSAVLSEACRNVSVALSQLQGFGDLRHHLVEVHRLENEGDRILREGLASLFADGIDPMLVIRWKDIFGRLEQAIDACETAANIIETIVVKHG